MQRYLLTKMHVNTALRSYAVTVNVTKGILCKDKVSFIKEKSDKWKVQRWQQATLKRVREVQTRFYKFIMEMFVPYSIGTWSCLKWKHILQMLVEMMVSYNKRVTNTPINRFNFHSFICFATPTFFPRFTAPFRF